MAVARLVIGNRLETIDCDAGIVPASPTPTPIRARKRCQKFCAKPQVAVITLKIPVQMTMMLRRLNRSARAAMGMPSEA